MRKPTIGDLLEIWKKIEGSPHGLEEHLVMCTGAQPSGDTFRYIHHFDGKLCVAEIKKINRILEGEEKDLAHTKFKAKQKKENKNGY